MCKPVEKYPGFHKIEIIAELEKPLRKGAALRAVRETNDENAAHKRFITQSSYTSNSVLIRKLSEDLMVISFYSSTWDTYRLKYFRELDQLQYVVGSLGGQLTVVEPNESNVDPTSNISGYDLNLHFYFHPTDLFADRFRIYSKNFNDGDTNTNEENNIIGLANYIINNFYKAAFTLMDTRPDQLVRHPILRYA